MKKNFLIGLVFSGLLVLSVLVYHKISRPSTLNKSERDFAVKDTASITRIRISNKNREMSELVRTDSGWIVNGKYPIRPDAYFNLMEAIKRVEVFYPVPQSQRELVFRSLAHQAIKVEIFKGKNCIKKYYLGGETPDGQGTYMLLSYENEDDKNYENPMVTGIPGFVGFLSPRFITKEEWWRSTEILKAHPSEIQQIEMNNLLFPDSSFVIRSNNGTAFVLLDHKGNALPANPFKLKQYLSYFLSLHIELYFTIHDKSIADSLMKKGVPFRIFTVVKKNGKKEKFSCYRRPVDSGKDDEFKAAYSYDPDRFYLLKNCGKSYEFCYAQYFVFGKLFVQPDYFIHP